MAAAVGFPDRAVNNSCRREFCALDRAISRVVGKAFQSSPIHEKNTGYNTPWETGRPNRNSQLLP